MAYTIQIGSYTFAITPLMKKAIVPKYAEDGTIDSIEERWSISGFLSDPTVSGLRTKINALEVVVKAGEQNVYLRESGTVVDDLLISGATKGPVVENFQTAGGQGEQVAYLQFSFDILRTSGAPGTEDETDIETQLGWVVIKNVTKERWWHKRARGDGSEELVKGFKPAGYTTKETYIQDVEQDQWTADYRWPLSGSSDGGEQGDNFVTYWTETISVTGGGQPIMVQPIVSGNLPLLNLGRFRPWIVMITGRIEGLTKELAAPDKHPQAPADEYFDPTQSELNNTPSVKTYQEGTLIPDVWEVSYKFVYVVPEEDAPILNPRPEFGDPQEEEANTPPLFQGL